MRILITSLALALGTMTLWSQSLTVDESSKAKEALSKINSSTRKRSTINGYRVGIFFNNDHNARYNANEAKAKFKNSFPSEPVYIIYESPYYKVSVGDCLTEEEAIMLFERVRGVFPDAYVMREEIKLSSFIDAKSIITDPIEQPETNSVDSLPSNL
ncbi:MAG: hypothetical protein R3Y08_03905 [Rikenellaceae bacterium]